MPSCSSLSQRAPEQSRKNRQRGGTNPRRPTRVKCTLYLKYTFRSEVTEIHPDLIYLAAARAQKVDMPHMSIISRSSVGRALDSAW